MSTRAAHLLAAGNAFDRALSDHHLSALRRGPVTTLQVNAGLRCNQACHHCHVGAGPHRRESMTARTAESVLRLLAESPQTTTLDLTGGAPELHGVFRHLVREARRMGKHVIDRCNLTVLSVPGQEDTAEFLRDNEVEVVASLPCYTKENVEAQRGRGVYEPSIEALRGLNALGYGLPGSKLRLNLVYNPGGAFLPPGQAGLEAAYRKELDERFGIAFTGLFTITNMPIKRFAEFLERRGETERYMGLLVTHFNMEAALGVMCKSLVSVSWNGRLFDCDFNQMLEMPLLSPGGPATVESIASLGEVEGLAIVTGDHCYGCTAGEGSSCNGAMVP